jgi:hypothetical protein
MEGGLPYTPWAAEIRKQRLALQARDNPDANCMPMGFLQFHQQPQPRMIIQTPKMILIEYEANYGIRHIYTDGRALPKDNLQASILLPMGRHGPAFIVYENFQVYLTWNNSLVYSTTAAWYATRLAGAGPMRQPAQPIPSVSPEQAKEIQQHLTKLGYDVGGIDGKLGLASRTAIKAAQLKLGMPADSYPTPELLERLKAGR